MRCACGCLVPTCDPESAELTDQMPRGMGRLTRAAAVGGLVGFHVDIKLEAAGGLGHDARPLSLLSGGARKAGRGGASYRACGSRAARWTPSPLLACARAGAGSTAACVCITGPGCAKLKGAGGTAAHHNGADALGAVDDGYGEVCWDIASVLDINCTGKGEGAGGVEAERRLPAVGPCAEQEGWGMRWAARLELQGTCLPILLADQSHLAAGSPRRYPRVARDSKPPQNWPSKVHTYMGPWGG